MANKSADTINHDRSYGDQRDCSHCTVEGVIDNFLSEKPDCRGNGYSVQLRTADIDEPPENIVQACTIQDPDQERYHGHTDIRKRPYPDKFPRYLKTGLHERYQEIQNSQGNDTNIAHITRYCWKKGNYAMSFSRNIKGHNHQAYIRGGNGVKEDSLRLFPGVPPSTHFLSLRLRYSSNVLSVTSSQLNLPQM